MQTYTEIENIIDAEIASKPELNGLTDSNASEWKLWKALYATVALSFWFLWEQAKTTFSAVINAQAKVGTGTWIKDRFMEFQFGDPLINTEGVLGYQTLDLTKRIITQCAPTTSNNKVLVKVATAAGVLTTEQRSALLDYWQAVHPFGMVSQIISENPDKAKAVIIIYYDGKLIKSEVETAVNAAITAYITTGLPFNGAFNLNRFQNALQTAVRNLSPECDVTIEDLQIRTAIGTYTSVVYEYMPLSGRYSFGFPNDANPTDRSTITYVSI